MSKDSRRATSGRGARKRSATPRQKRARSQTDWARLDAVTDEDIRQQIARNPDAAPELDAEWFAKAELRTPERKHAISLRVDSEVLEWFRRQGPGYQSRMNAVLKQYKEHREAAGNRGKR